MRARLDTGQRYRLMRWTLVQLRRLARRYHVNIENAFESSAKDVR